MKVLSSLVCTAFAALLLSSCATIVGGSHYIASVEVDDNRDAQIFYNDKYQGTGIAKFKVKRKDADKFVVIVKQEGCAEQKFAFNSRKFRGWAFAGSLLFWSLNTGSVPIPIGGAVDLINGALWKPDVTEFGVSKQNYKNYRYVVDYASCEPRKKPQEMQLDRDAIIDVVYLKNGSVIRGIIFEQIPMQQIKIQTSDGNIFVYNVSDIERITRE